MVHMLNPPKLIGHQPLSRDNRRIYFTCVSSEADIWLLTLVTARLIYPLHCEFELRK